MDTGPFAVAAGYHRYRENPRKWVKESKSYQQKAINSVHEIKLLSHIPSELNSSSDSGMCSSSNADSHYPLGMVIFLLMFPLKYCIHL